MSIEERANRIKDSIKNAGGYESVSAKTGINSRTLKRIASGETEPKFKDIIALNNLTGLGCDFYAYGHEYAIERLNQNIDSNTSKVADRIKSFKDKGEQGNDLFTFVTGFIDLMASSTEETIKKHPDETKPEVAAFSSMLKEVQTKLKENS